MWKRKRKNIVNQDEAVELFTGFGYRAIKLNYYQIRIWPEETEKFYDWYHTTGSLCVTSYRGCAKIGVFQEAEDVATFTNKHLKSKICQNSERFMGMLV